MSPISESILATDLIRRRELLRLAGAAAISAMVGASHGHGEEPDGPDRGDQYRPA